MISFVILSEAKNLLFLARDSSRGIGQLISDGIISSAAAFAF
jgi:hypothetical protein